MCFNETVSMTIFFMITIAYSIYMRVGDTNTAFFVIIVGLMQFAEYLAHKAIRLKNRNLMLYASMGIYTLLLLQPLAEFITDFYYPKKQYFLRHPFIWFGIIYGIYLLIALYLKSIIAGRPALYLIDGKYCPKTLCRLEWKALSYDVTISSALFVFYILAHLTLSSGPTYHFGYFLSLLTGLLYVLFVDKVTDKTLFGLWGSMWCLWGALFLPIALFRNK